MKKVILNSIFMVFLCAASAFAAPQDNVSLTLDKVGLLSGLAFVYGLGFLLAFTPCVFPMIPVTVAYFTSQAQEKNKKTTLLAAVYVLGLAISYAALGTIAALSGGVFGAAMQTKPVLIGISVILVVLATSMFGLFDLQPPAFVTKNASARSGIVGAFIMGALFGFVAAPCVGPAVIGLLSYVAASGSALKGGLLFFSLAIGLGTPFFFLAAFAAKLPAPGMWMMTVKKVAGFLFLGAAAYFILPIVPVAIKPFLIPAVIFAAGAYFVFIDKTIKSASLGRKFAVVLGIFLMIFAVLAAVPKKAPLKEIAWQPYTKAAFEKAKTSGKPIMIDFGAEWCHYCKVLEEKTFPDKDVINESERFINFKYDATKSDDTKVIAEQEQFQIQGLPTIVFFNSDGNEAESQRIVGFVEPDILIENMKEVK